MARARSGARYSSRDAVIAILDVVAPPPSRAPRGSECNRVAALELVQRELPGLCARHARDFERAYEIIKCGSWREMLDALAYARGCDAPWHLRSPREALALFEVSP